MHRLSRWMGLLLACLAACLAAGVLAFDVAVARPCADRIKRELEAAAPSERRPPAVLLDMLQRAYGDRITQVVARDAAWKLLEAEPHVGRLRRVAIEGGLLLLLPWHLTDAELASALLTDAYMGDGVHGFAAASRRDLGVSLELVSAEQAARLVAISWSPSSLENPDRLQRRVQSILAKPSALARP
ncbi:transglycosylase domain-containing protein [Roseateles sp.]|uniref:transglycosylase domain-containing protein n=1 Tax=Roseateles sp. TaxID=1971397 RepID=UPI003263B3A0